MAMSSSASARARASVKASDMHTIPISDRPPHGPLFSKIFFPLLFDLGIIGIHTTQLCALPLLLIPIWGRKWFEAVIDWTKDGFGRLREWLFLPLGANFPYDRQRPLPETHDIGVTVGPSLILQ